MLTTGCPRGTLPAAREPVVDFKRIGVQFDSRDERSYKPSDKWVDGGAGLGGAKPHLPNELVEFGAPLDELTEADFASPGIVFQIGVEPVRIDILTQPDGIEFADAWFDRVESQFGGVPTQVLSKRALIQNKRASGRSQDIADVEALSTSDDG